MTFDPDAYDEHPYAVQLLTYGNPLFAELLDVTAQPPSGTEPRGIGLFRGGSPRELSLFVAPGGSGPRALDTLLSLDGCLSRPIPAWTDKDVTAAHEMVQAARQALDQSGLRVGKERRGNALLAIEEEARQVLARTALVDIALAQTPDLFAEGEPRTFGTDAVLALRAEGVPYKALLAIGGEEGLGAEPSDPFFLVVQGQSQDALRRRREALAQEGVSLLHRYKALQAQRPFGRLAGRQGLGAPRIEPVWMAPTPESGATHEAAAVTKRRPPLPFRVVQQAELRPYENALPLFSLAAAAGAFSASHEVGLSPEQWVAPAGRTRPRPNLFVARVVGESMNRRIPNGAWCIFRHPVEGSREGKVVLAQLQDAADPEHGGRYTVKVYHSTKRGLPDGTWRHERIELAPDSTDPVFTSLIFTGREAAPAVTVVAELIEVLDRF